jgi:hypothetical protein
MTVSALTVDDLRAVHVADLRALATDPRHHIQAQRRKLFARLGLIEFGWAEKSGARRWLVTQAGHDLLAKTTVGAAPEIPRSLVPPNGYYMGDQATKRKPDRYDRPVQPPGVFKKGLTR